LRILTEPKLTKDCWWEDTDSAEKDLEELGRDSLPIILRELPNLSAPAVDVAARVFENKGYKEAAPALAARISDLHPCSELGWARNNPAIAVLKSLAKIGGPPQIESISRIMLDQKQDPETRREAFATLASIGNSDITEVLDSTLDS